MSAAPLSVVVPVIDDDQALARLLAALRAMAPAPAEIIVADGAGSNACRQLCEQHGARHLCAPAGRGPQLRHGAAVAGQPVLWFLHADAVPAAGATAAILACLAANASGGYFRFRFTGTPGRSRRALAALVNWRARWGVPYGDQGLFVTRAAYDAAGGFAATPLFEEVPLVRALRRAGGFVALPEEIGVSPRRWECDGWVRRTVRNRLLALGYMAGVSPARLARHYRRPAPRVAPARPQAGS